jgi:hypothetical protein
MPHLLPAKVGTEFAGYVGRLVGAVRLRTKSHRFCFVSLKSNIYVNISISRSSWTSEVKKYEHVRDSPEAVTALVHFHGTRDVS